MKSNWKQKSILYIVLAVSAIMVFFPIFYAVMISFMTHDEVIENKLIPAHFNFQNYKDVFHSIPLLIFIKNSIVMTSIITIARILTSCMQLMRFRF